MHRYDDESGNYYYLLTPDMDPDSCVMAIGLPDGWGPPVATENSVNVSADLFVGAFLVVCFIGGWIAGAQR